MLKFALKHTGPISIANPKTKTGKVERHGPVTTIEMGKAR